MEDTILKVLENVACSNTGTCQINLQSESAREMIANKVADALRREIQDTIEQVFVSTPEDRSSHD
jgi:hypothetical protein